MKIKIIYFSQANNTKKVAEAIYNGIKFEAEEINLFRVSEVNPIELKKYDFKRLFRKNSELNEKRTNLLFFDQSNKGLNKPII